MSTIVLLSGGIDSTSCLSFFLKRGFRVGALFVDYGQRAARMELRAARSVCRHFGVSLRVVILDGAKRKGEGLILGRNGFLVLTALLEARMKKGIIALGVHSGTRYSDCSRRFLRQMQGIVDTYMGGTVQVVAPFVDWSKPEIWRFAQGEDVPLALTYSCERGFAQPCGRCDSCRDVEKLHAGSN